MSRAGLRNLVLLTIDAWRADFVDDFAGVPLTPSLAAVRERTVRFSNAYATGPWTSPALVSMFTGESPARHGVHFEWSTPRPGGPGLSAALRAAGYRVPNLCYLNRVGNYHNLGYEVADTPGYPKSPEDALLLDALRAHRGCAEPYFLWYHYKFVHLPYWPAPQYRRLFGIDDEQLPQHLRESVCKEFVVPRQKYSLQPQDRELVQRLYAANVRQMDAFLAAVLAELDADTTLVLTADHGDELLEHGHVGHASTAHYATLYEEVLRIPLLIIDPRARAKTVAARVWGADLFPTLLSLAGVRSAETPESAESVDLTPLLFTDSQSAAAESPRCFYFHSSRRGYQTPRAEEAHTVSALSDGRHKLIVEEYAAPQTLLYDLRRDLQELHPLAEVPPQLPQLLAEVRAGAPLPSGPLLP